MKRIAKITLATLALAVPACGGLEADADLVGLDGQVAGVQQHALTGDPADLCTPRITGAAITEQSTVGFGTPAWNHPAQVTVELTTISPKPFRMVGTSFSLSPAGVGRSFGTSSCVLNSTGTAYRCSARVTAPVNICFASGDYQILFAAIADDGSDCGNGQVPINFRLTTENLCNETVATDAGAAGALYQHGSYGGTAQEVWEGFYDMAALAVGNDAISSLKVAPGWKITLFEHEHFQGAYQTFTGDVPYVGNAWNDRASSVLVERQ